MTSIFLLQSRSPPQDQTQLNGSLVSQPFITTIQWSVKVWMIFFIFKHTSHTLLLSEIVCVLIGFNMNLKIKGFFFFFAFFNIFYKTAIFPRYSFETEHFNISTFCTDMCTFGLATHSYRNNDDHYDNHYMYWG